MTRRCEECGDPLEPFATRWCGECLSPQGLPPFKDVHVIVTKPFGVQRVVWTDDDRDALIQDFAQMGITAESITVPFGRE